MKNMLQTPVDPRIRRTRKLLQDALQLLLEQKSFNDISITDICKQADIARVTFYQHYDSKEALLLAAVADFFATMHTSLDHDAVNDYLQTGEMSPNAMIQPIPSVDPKQVKLIGVALAHIGSAVRKLTTPLFQKVLLEHETELNEKEVEILATFYIGGVLNLLEQFLSGNLSLTPMELQSTTLPLLRALRQGMLESAVIKPSSRPSTD